MASRLAAGPPSATQAPDLAQLGVPDQAEGRAIIEGFRESGPAQAYYAEFELRQLPRRGQETTFKGRLWAGRNQAGKVLRIELNPGDAGERRFLVQGGESAAVWFYDPREIAARPRKIGPLTPLVPGIETTPFDVQMPFLYWPDESLLSITRAPGLQRPAYVFLFRPPADFEAADPGMGGVRAYIDTQYNAPVQTETIGSNGRILKTMTLVGLKKIQGQYLPKEIDVRNDATRDKTRFELTAAAMGVALAPSFLEPGQLSAPAAIPPSSKIERFSP
jgi:hypothetical protein